MGLSIRAEQNAATGLWTAVGDDGSRSHTATADTCEEAQALVHEEFGLPAHRPPPPLRPGWHRFTLIHCPVGEYPRVDDPRYDGIRSSPPEGCHVEDVGEYFGLRCERPGVTLLDAVAGVCAEVRAEHGVLMTDLGVEKLWEWSSDGADGWGATIVSQLLLMAAERGPRLGYDVDDLVRFLRTAAGEASG
ncbi:hypothetical protein ACIBI8_24720 [Streptomyces sp. NPDC050529]|uniref:hypothetical protein n=1 Tax=Streptomyces sp. NPDC050529 TaxID=3365624 RepID=UPI0037BBC844